MRESIHIGLMQGSLCKWLRIRFRINKNTKHPKWAARPSFFGSLAVQYARLIVSIISSGRPLFRIIYLSIENRGLSVHMWLWHQPSLSCPGTTGGVCRYAFREAWMTTGTYHERKKMEMEYGILLGSHRKFSFSVLSLLWMSSVSTLFTFDLTLPFDSQKLDFVEDQNPF